MEKLDKLFEAARNQRVEFTFDEAKESFVSRLNNPLTRAESNFQKVFTVKNFLIMLSSLILIVIIGHFLISTSSGIHKNEMSSPIFENNQSSHVDEKKVLNVGNTENIVALFSGRHSKKTPDSIEVFGSVTERILGDFQTNNQSFVPYQGAVLTHIFTDEPYIPNLNSEEITANHKKKKQMLKALEKFDKKEFAMMPSGTFEYEERTVSLQSFVIQKAEVTNLEYRTFLFDLLIQGRKDEFLKAKPDQSQWIKSKELIGSYLGPMEETYFSSKAYDEYPVVNVSREGADMYCKWLSQELMKFIDKDKQKQFNDVRLPGRVEWVYAASAGGSDYPYPWKGQFLRDSKGCFLANYKPFENSYQDDGGFLTVKTQTYNPNSVGIYNMSGNVAEMVYNSPNSRKEPGTAGGGWMNNAEEIKILGPDPYSGITDAHPNIGFRVVMTVLNH